MQCIMSSCLSLYIYIYTCVHTDTDAYTRIHTWMHVYTIRERPHIHDTYICIYMYIYIYIYVYAHAYLYACIHTCMHTYTHNCIRTNACKCIYMYMYSCKGTCKGSDRTVTTILYANAIKTPMVMPGPFSGRPKIAIWAYFKEFECVVLIAVV